MSKSKRKLTVSEVNKNVEVVVKSKFSGEFECPVCKKKMSNAGAGRTSHMRKHVKEETATESRDEKTGKLVFTPTGKEPKLHKNIFIDRSHLRGGQFNDPRRKINFKADKKERITIECWSCGKWQEPREFADDRFVSIQCECKQVSLVAKRALCKAIRNPGTVITE